MSTVFQTSGSRVPTSETIRILIDDVDLVNRVVHARDQTMALIQIVFNEQAGGITSIPAQGELWIATRRGFTWYLDRKVDRSDLTGLQAGDTRVYADRTLIFEAETSRIGDNPWGATIHDYYFNASGGFTSIVLSRDPVGDVTIYPFLNGLQVEPHLWTYASESRTLTFYEEIGEIGTMLVSYQTWDSNYDDLGTVVGRGFITGSEDFIDV